MNLNSSSIVRFLIAGAAPAFVLGGCAGVNAVSPTIPAPVQSSSRSVRPADSWMLPQARKSALIYAVDSRTGDVNVYDYANGKQVGTISGDFIESAEGCVDARGDVYLTAAGDVYEYAHGGTQALRTYTPGGDVVGCSIDAKGDLAVSTTSPGEVIVYARGNPKRSSTFSNSLCVDQAALGYDDKGNVIGESSYAKGSICAVLARAREETTLSANGISINSANGTMWDGKYIALSDGEAGSGKNETGIYQATLSGSTLTSQGEVMLTDTCYRGYNFILNPFVVGAKNTPANERQSNVVVGANAFCFESSGGGGLEFWHYPKGGNPFKMYVTTDEISVLAVSLPV